ncbi:hypothetical protein D3C87_1451080 [compost metagenome]
MGSGSGRGVVSTSASRAIRSGACAAISSATMPPREKPSSAKRSGARASSRLARSGVVSAPSIGITRMSGWASSAISGANSRASQTVPGNSSSGTPEACWSFFANWVVTCVFMSPARGLDERSRFVSPKNTGKF